MSHMENGYGRNYFYLSLPGFRFLITDADMEHIINSHVNNFIALIKPQTCLLLDNASAEILHWTADIVKLYEKGVIEIKVISSFTQVTHTADSLLFLIQAGILKLLHHSIEKKLVLHI